MGYLVLGIDPSLRASGVAVLEVFAKREKVIYTAQWPISKNVDENAAYVLISRKIDELLKKFPRIKYCSIEDTIPGHDWHTIQVLNSVRGIFRERLTAHGIEIVSPTPKQIKKLIYGSGKAEKDELRQKLINKYGLNPAITLDESDALAAALVGKDFIAKKL